MPSHSRALFMLVLTMVIWGSTFVVTKGINEQVPPFTLALGRVAIGAAVLGIAALFRRRSGAAAKYSALPWRTIWMMGLVGVALYYSVFNLALMYTSAAQGALVQSCLPAMTALVAIVWLREHSSIMRWTGIALSIAGVLLVFSGAQAPTSSGGILGNVLMFSSGVLWGIYTSLAKRAAQFDPLAITAGVMGAGALLLLPLTIYEVLAQGTPLIQADGWLGLVYLGAGASGLGYLLYSTALKHVDASEAGVYTNLIPIVGVLSGVLLGEPLTLRAVLGGCVVLVGVWITSRSEPKADAA